jgi:LPS sulfotransferase NodH
MVDFRLINIDAHSQAVRERLDVHPDKGDPIDCGKGLIIVAFTNRSGSNLVCSALSELGLAGPPHAFSYELLNSEHVTPICDAVGIDDFDEYLRHVVSEHRGASGFTTIKASAFQVNHLIESGAWGRMRPAPIVLVVRRRNVLRQAVSFWTALQDGAWTSVDVGDPDARVEFDEAAILEHCRNFYFGNALLDMLCDVHGLRSHSLWYEDFAGDPAGLVAELADLFDLPPVPVQPSFMPVERQVSKAKEEWEAMVRTSLRTP